MEYPDADKGKCLTCGFLSKHACHGGNWPHPRFYEIDRGERTSARHYDLFQHRPDMAAHGSVQTDIVCFVDVVDLMAGIRDVSRSTAEGQQIQCSVVLENITFERHCPSWYPYTPGFSAIEHYEELKMQRLEADRRDFDLRLSELNRKAQEDSLRVAEASKQAVSDLKDIALANDRFTRRVTTLVVLLAILQTVSTVLALPSISWVQRLWHHFFG